MSNKLKPTDKSAGYDVRPGDFLTMGATKVECGVNFTVMSIHAIGCEVVLYKRGARKPYARIPFPPNYRIGNTYSMLVFGLNIDEFEYTYRIREIDPETKRPIYTPELLDIYAKAVVGQRKWGEKETGSEKLVKARVVENTFDWGNFVEPNHKFSDLIIYEMHVRGFTMDPSSKVKYPGSFKGIIEKIPYLKKLGINAIELMPIFEFDEMEGERVYNGKRLLNYWGYSPVSFFAPNTSYASSAEHNHEGHELKETIKALNENGIEVIMDVVFNHTAEGNFSGPTISFKGYDQSVYYMMTPQGDFFNFSGCGNTLNCNHPVVRRMILDCLRSWVILYRVDGFRFDLASILGRDQEGNPMSAPPLLEALAFDPILSKVKLIAEVWDAGGLYQVGSFPAWRRWAEWNGRYRDDIRKFLKSDANMADIAIQRITGSRDIYERYSRGENASVNFITCHDGFTLYDLYAYNEKHNEDNGWNNTDGANDNNSWNCGAEGETDDKEILALRKRMRFNAITALFLSRGAAMFLAGDEMCNTQYGNNNAYCQDNEISYLNWDNLKKNKDTFDYFARAIDFRKKHPVVRQKLQDAHIGFPDISIHVEHPWNSNVNSETRTFGIMYAGREEKAKADDVVFVGFNMYWEWKDQYLPELPPSYKWKLAYTSCEDNYFDENENRIALIGRSVAVFEMVKNRGK